MVPADPLGRIASFFDELVGRESDEMRALDYGRRETQTVRFDALTGLLPFAGARVLDVGCGLAHLADHLEARVGGVQYTGVDISPKMVAAARARRPGLDVRLCNILVDDPGGSYDVVVANGIFYLLGEDGSGVMEALVRRMWGLAGVALGFTSLSAWAPDRSEDEFHADPLATLGWCRELTERLAFRHDYLPHDFAIALYRGSGA